MTIYIIRKTKNPNSYMQERTTSNTKHINSAWRVPKSTAESQFGYVKSLGWDWVTFDEDGKIVEMLEFR